MTEGEHSIFVTCPNERIETELSSVSLDTLFLQSLFEISIAQGKRRIIFAANLPEWLQAYTDLLNQGRESKIDRLLLLSGERFIGEVDQDRVRINVFDVSEGETFELNLSYKEAGGLHTSLVSHLQRCVDLAAGRHLRIQDVDRLKLSH